jgi:hypothetical protein
MLLEHGIIADLAWICVMVRISLVYHEEVSLTNSSGMMVTLFSIFGTAVGVVLDPESAGTRDMGSLFKIVLVLARRLCKMDSWGTLTSLGCVSRCTGGSKVFGWVDTKFPLGSGLWIVFADGSA